MPSNVAVRPKEPELSLGFLSVMMIFALIELFHDKEAAEEHRRQMEFSMQQTISQAYSQVLDAVAGSLASGLNVLLQHVTHFLQAAGIQVALPVNTVTPEGVIFVAQWVLLLLICYGVLAIAFLLATFLLKRLWWLLKVVVALACFGLIVSDHSVDMKTTAIRLVCLGCACIVLNIRSWKDQTMAARIVYLEEQVKILENQVREMEKWRRRCAILFCLIVLLCFVFFIVFKIYVVLSNSKSF